MDGSWLCRSYIIIIIIIIIIIMIIIILTTNSMAYGTRRFNAAFTRALQ